MAHRPDRRRLLMLARALLVVPLAGCAPPLGENGQTGPRVGSDPGPPLPADELFPAPDRSWELHAPDDRSNRIVLSCRSGLSDAIDLVVGIEGAIEDHIRGSADGGYELVLSVDLDREKRTVFTPPLPYLPPTLTPHTPVAANADASVSRLESPERISHRGTARQTVELISHRDPAQLGDAGARTVRWTFEASFGPATVRRMTTLTMTAAAEPIRYEVDERIQYLGPFGEHRHDVYVRDPSPRGCPALSEFRQAFSK